MLSRYPPTPAQSFSAPFDMATAAFHIGRRRSRASPAAPRRPRQADLQPLDQAHDGERREAQTEAATAGVDPPRSEDLGRARLPAPSSPAQDGGPCAPRGPAATHWGRRSRRHHPGETAWQESGAAPRRRVTDRCAQAEPPAGGEGGPGSLRRRGCRSYLYFLKSWSDSRKPLFSSMLMPASASSASSMGSGASPSSRRGGGCCEPAMTTRRQQDPADSPLPTYPPIYSPARPPLYPLLAGRLGADSACAEGRPEGTGCPRRRERGALRRAVLSPPARRRCGDTAAASRPQPLQKQRRPPRSLARRRPGGRACAEWLGAGWGLWVLTAARRFVWWLR